MLTFRLLEVYRQIVDSGSVTGASEQLGLSQPTVSLQLKKLTDLLGMPLVESHHGTLRMTETGQVAYQCAQEVLSSQDKLMSRIQAISGLQVGKLKIAVVTTAKYVVPPLLAEYCRLHDKVEVELKVANRADVVERLRQNMDDVYIFSQPPDGMAIDRHPFAENRLQVIAHTDYMCKARCTLSDLKEEKFLLREEGSGTRKLVDEYLHQTQLELPNVMLIESNEAIRLSVASGLGLAIISEHILEQCPDPRIRVLPVQDFPLISRWQAVTSHARPLNQAAQAFLAFLERQKSDS